jgi:hypothetical protein
MASMGEVIRLGAGDIEAAVAPELGGRLLSLQCRGDEYLWRNPRLLDDELRPTVPVAPPAPGSGFEQWQNWGGEKTWPAPQGWDGDGQWPGPPDGVLDGGRYRVLHRGSARVVLESASEPRTGLAIRREIAVRPGGTLSVDAVLTNVSTRHTRWAAWSVAQLPFTAADAASDTAGVVVGIAEEGAGPAILFDPIGRIATEAAGEGAVRVPFADVVGKIGFPASAGRAEYRAADGRRLRLDFRVAGGAEYPDACPFQLWMQAPIAGGVPGFDGMDLGARLVEVEALSPLRDLAPGETVSLETVYSFPRGEIRGSSE